MSLTIREEKILEAAVAGEQSPIEPVTRREAIFAKATGADVELPPARNKEEDILSKLAVGYAEGGGGGGGYLGIQTANVEITFDYSEVGEGIVNGFEDGFYDIRTENASNAIQFTFGPYGFPVSLMGEPANLTIPIVEGYPTRFNITWIMNTNDPVIAEEITVLSGSAEDTDDGLYITGDCSLLVKLVILS